ncbi:serine/threonine-protein kinase Smg1 [Teleopsis dalmanni]|uniref:serine/threonine-protein kinase Smg1 n=1 Tax=Teleopsis dalmanni TaxID=139649 RepID=UPI0018CC9F0B|nr:serine/threonine-protein kinase Smg1 [Teleopsis dalmanni]
MHSKAADCGPSYSGTMHDLCSGGMQLSVGHLDFKSFNKNETQTLDADHMFSTQVSLHTDDLRISKIVRRLLAENVNAQLAFELLCKFEAAIRLPANSSFIRRSFDNLLENMISILKHCPKETLEKAGTIFGLLGYINRCDFVSYKNCVTKAFQTNKNIRKYLMIAMKTTISCDVVNMDLNIFSERLLGVLKDYLENAETTEIFIIISETIAEFSKIYKKSFEIHFTDVVDIIVGWHLEVEQPLKLKWHCAFVLQQYAQYFLKQLDFTISLLGQFLEDIVSFGDDIANKQSEEKVKQSCDNRIGAFIGAYNSIFKALAFQTNFFNFESGDAIIQKGFDIILKVTRQTLNDDYVSEETILSINDYICTLYEHNFSVSELIEIETIIQLELNHLMHFNDQQTRSLLFLILIVIRSLRTNLSCTLVSTIFKSDSPLSVIKLSSQEDAFELLLLIYYEVLVLKNVPLLQEAYKHIQNDMSYAIQILSGIETESYYIEKAKAILNFNLTSLTALATQTSSIIGMYALNPSILELLIVNCQIGNMDMWCKYSSVHNSVLYLLKVHCQNNRNFWLTSNILVANRFSEDNPDDNNSPTSENFSLILQFLADIIEQCNKITNGNLILLLGWLNNLLVECKQNSELLQKNENFIRICSALSSTVKQCPSETAKCLLTILMYSKISEDVLFIFRDLALTQLDSNNIETRNIYLSIFTKIPLNVLLSPLETSPSINKYDIEIREAQKWYKMSTHTGALRGKYFTPILDKFKFSASVITNWEQLLTNVFEKCTTQQNGDDITHQKLIKISRRALFAWFEHEAARYCVNNKMRTSIGKPQETFLAIEAIVIDYARTLATINVDDLSKESTDNLLQIKRNASILLGFLESLEKQIYNAGEGTAFAILSPEQPAKTFFRVNAHTCNEWFKRIRLGVNLIAQYCNAPDYVIRYAEHILAIDQPKNGHFDQVITSLTWGLLQGNESDNLKGLYTWLKTNAQKRYPWILYASDQAAGRRETASIGYAKILDEFDDSIDACVKDFIINQLWDCYYYTGQWTKMRKLLERFTTFKHNSVITNIRSDAHIDVMEALIKGYHSENEKVKMREAFLQLSNWSFDNNEGEDHLKANYVTVQKLEDICLTLSVEVNPNISQEVHNSIQTYLNQSLFNDCINEWSNLTTDLVILNHAYNKINDDDLACGLDSFNCSQSVKSSTILTKCLHWSLICNESALDANNINKNCSIYLDIAAVARNEGNINYCQIMLERFFAQKGFTEPLPAIMSSIQSESFIIDFEDNDLQRAYIEAAKCIYIKSVPEQVDAINVAAAYCSRVAELAEQNAKVVYPVHSANMLLTMADWIQQRNFNVTSINSPQLEHLLTMLPEISVNMADTSMEEIIPDVERAVGKIINASIFQQPNMSEAWFAFGNWCYRWGKKMVETQNVNSDNCQNGTFTQSDLNAIQEVLGTQLINQNDIKQLSQVLSLMQPHSFNGPEDIETNDISSVDAVIYELRKTDLLINKSQDQILKIIKIWRQAHKSIYVFYEMATKAYFKYLAITSTNRDSCAKQCYAEDSYLVTTTLRILRLVVKHAIGLQEVLEEGFNATPLQPWKIIIPQLFSRLNHHEPYVRKSVSELLCRLAESRPHLVIFPAVVGAQQEQRMINYSTTSKNAVIGATLLKDGENQSSKLSYCFNSLLLTLSKQTPNAVLHVQLLVKELKRVSLLWEEYWLHALTQLCSEYATLFTSLDIELKKRVDSKEKLISKFEILLIHLVKDLEKIAIVTSQKAETNYERNFQTQYNGLIKSTIAELKKPFNINKPHDIKYAIKHLYSVFQQRSSRGIVSTYKISDLSPVLAQMCDTEISMPGVENFDKTPVYIKSVDSTVYILPTKTKPKKLAFFGSDGRKYTYLFKGLEDLHLDERIMQFLSIANSMMARSIEDPHNTNCYKAQHYSVIPLGPQSGLISWVDDVTPLFSLYKKWQQREATIKQEQRQRKNSNNERNTAPSTVTRPTEVFYNKLTPLLAEHNLKVTDARKLWPLSALRQVYDDLTAETPKDLLAKELWCYSENASNWRKTVRKYVNSIAVMSVIGYIIGLGDRHLDNILIKLSSGEIVHIDYNVCFEKGKTLRVPEKVPFRMTPNLVEAMGLTGIEGAFRLGCEYVMKTLRKEKETLLTLLEAFVYDPLVDWTVGEDGVTSNRATTAHEAALSISIQQASTEEARKSILKAHKPDDFMIRKHHLGLTRQTIDKKYKDIKPRWEKYKNEIISKLMSIDNETEQFIKHREIYQQAEKERTALSKQLAKIHELEALGSAMSSHAFNTISQRYQSFKRNAVEFSNVKQKIEEDNNRIKKLLSVYFDDLTSTTAHQKLKYLQLQISDQPKAMYISEFDTVYEMLKQNPQHADLDTGAKRTRAEMDSAYTKLTGVAHDCLDALVQYTSIMQFYSRTQLQQHRLVQTEQIYQELLEQNKLTESLKQYIDDLKKFKHTQDAAIIDSIRKYSHAMDNIWEQLNGELSAAVKHFNSHKQKKFITVEVADNAIRDFISIKKQHLQILQLSMLDILSKGNSTFLQVEEEAIIKKDPYLLDQQIDHINIYLTLCQSIFYEDNQPNLIPLHKLLSTLQALHTLKSAFLLDITERIIWLFVVDNDVNLQKCLDIMCSTPSSLAEFCKSRRSRLTDELFTLLAEINSIFDRFESEFKQLKRIRQNILDKMEDCKYKQFVQMRTFSSAVNVISTITRSELISQIFSTIRNHVTSLRSFRSQNVYDIREITKIVTDYVDHLENSIISGLAPLFTHSLYNDLKSFVRYNLEGIEKTSLAQAEELCRNLFVALKYKANHKNFQMRILQLKTCINHYTLVESAYYWANLEVLSNPKVAVKNVIVKGNLIDSLQETKERLMTGNNEVSDLQRSLVKYRNSIVHLINNEEMKTAFLDGIELQNSRFQFYEQMTTTLKGYVNVVLEFEQNHNASTTNKELSSTLDEWEEVYIKSNRSEAVITPTEVRIVELLDPEGKVDQNWIKNVLGLLDEMSFGVHRKLDSLEQEEEKIKSIFLVQSEQLQSLFETSVRLEMRQLLRSISKNEKYNKNGKIEVTEIATVARQLHQTFKQFYTKVSELQVNLGAAEYSSDALYEIKKSVSELLTAVEQNHNEFIQLLQKFLYDEELILSTAIQGENPNSDIYKNENHSPNTSDKKNYNQAEQKLNVHAVAVWRKVRAKLEGRDPDSNKRNTVAEQVDYIIQDAMNRDNLALLYEGWTPWV